MFGGNGYTVLFPPKRIPFTYQDILVAYVDEQQLSADYTVSYYKHQF
jgi:hypothetical protein